MTDINEMVNTLLDGGQLDDIINERLVPKMHRWTKRGAMIGGGLGAAYGGIHGYHTNKNKRISKKEKLKRAGEEALFTGIGGAVAGGIAGKSIRKEYAKHKKDDVRWTRTSRNLKRASRKMGERLRKSFKRKFKPKVKPIDPEKLKARMDATAKEWAEANRKGEIHRLDSVEQALKKTAAMFDKHRKKNK